MKRTIGVALILGMILLIPAYSVAEMTDPVNFQFARLRWDNRDYGNLGTYNWIGGSRSRSGAYIMIECGIDTTGIGDVTKVVAVNKSQNRQRQYILHYNPFNFLGEKVEYYVLLVQPDDEMFEGDWKIILHYKDSDGNEQQQVQPTDPPESVFPAAIGNVEVNKIKFDGKVYFRVSWSGIGEPGPENDFNYQVLVFDREGVDVIKAYSIDQDFGFYNSFLNKAIFFIPKKYGGKKYSLRLASGIYINRSLYYMILPKLDN